MSKRINSELLYVCPSYGELVAACIPESKKQVSRACESYIQCFSVLIQNLESVKVLIYETDLSNTDLQRLREVKMASPNLAVILISRAANNQNLKQFAGLALFAYHDGLKREALLSLDIERAFMEPATKDVVVADLYLSLLKSTPKMDPELLTVLSDKKALAALFESFDDSVTSTKKQLLVVEDNPRLNQQLVQWFSCYGYHCYSAFNAHEASEILRQEPDIALVLLDIGLPKVTGDEFVKSIKQYRPNARVVMLSAYKDEELVLNCMKSGADDFLTKPFEPKELLDVFEYQFKLSQLLRLPMTDLLQHVKRSGIQYSSLV